MLHSLQAITASPCGGRGEARLRRGVRPGHGRRGRPRPLGGPRLASSRSDGEPVPRLRRTTREASARVVGPRAQNQRGHRGRPQARGTGAGADGGRESEGGRGAWTSGHGGNA